MLANVVQMMSHVFKMNVAESRNFFLSNPSKRSSKAFTFFSCLSNNWRLERSALSLKFFAKIFNSKVFFWKGKNYDELQSLVDHFFTSSYMEDKAFVASVQFLEILYCDLANKLIHVFQQTKSHQFNFCAFYWKTIKIFYSRLKA